jgi:hypothetical protein
MPGPETKAQVLAEVFPPVPAPGCRRARVEEHLPVPAAASQRGLAAGCRRDQAVGYRRAQVAACLPDRVAASQRGLVAVSQRGPAAVSQLVLEAGCQQAYPPIGATSPRGQSSFRNSRSGVCTNMPTSSDPTCLSSRNRNVCLKQETRRNSARRRGKCAGRLTEVFGGAGVKRTVVATEDVDEGLSRHRPILAPRPATGRGARGVWGRRSEDASG